VYYVVGSMFHNSDDTPLFNINIIPRSNKLGQVEVYPVLRDYAYLIEDALDGIRAGGCPNFPTWVNNPQYAVKPYIGNAHVSTLIIPAPMDTKMKEIVPKSLGLCVFQDQDGTGKISKFSETVNELPNFAIARDLLVPDVEMDQGTYVMVPMSYKPEPDYQFAFTCVIYSNAPLKLGLPGVRGAKELFLNKDMRANTKALRTLQEFSQEALERADSPAEMRTTMQELFKKFDKNGNRQLDIGEFTQAVQAFTDGKIPDDEIERIFLMIDLASSDTVDYEEFADAVMNCCT